jgi:hypothetical protein
MCRVSYQLHNLTLSSSGVFVTNLAVLNSNHAATLENKHILKSLCPEVFFLEELPFCPKHPIFKPILETTKIQIQNPRWSR